jgi:hypothetical protein
MRGEFMKSKLDFISIRTVRVHKEQFDAIEKKANTVIVTCIEDGRCIAFSRENDSKAEKSI